MLDKRDSLFLAQTKKEKVIKRIITFDLLIFNINEFKDPLTLTFYFVTWIFFQERNKAKKLHIMKPYMFVSIWIQDTTEMIIFMSVLTCSSFVSW